MNSLALKPETGPCRLSSVHRRLVPTLIPLLLFWACLCLGRTIPGIRAAEMPRVQKNRGAWQLMVDGKPFLMRGGEFANNVYEAPKDLPGLEAMLDAYKSYALNTLLVPISWRSLEPQEGTFDFRMIDTLIEQCRTRDLRVVVLWFGVVKNGGLHYAPSWVIEDRERFFRAQWPNGKDCYAVSPFCEAAWQADRQAFVNLMDRIKEKDDGHYTVIMIQPENETGCQEIDESRDHCPAADQAWNAPVPEDLVKYLVAHDGQLVEWLQNVWGRAGKRSAGPWPEVCGSGADGQKVFMSYYIGRFIEHVASAGKAVYPLPMFINDWLGGLESPGGPIGGPEFHVMDIFRVTTPSVLAYAPDIYHENFKAWIAAFDQQDNPILIPEARSDARAAQQCWYAFLQHDGLLFSPYLLVPRESDQKSVPLYLTYSNLKMSYEVIAEMEDLILSRQGLRPRELLCFALDKTDKWDKSFQADFQGYTVKAQATRGFGKLTGGTEDEPRETPPLAALVKMGENDFLVIGKTMRVSFERTGYRLQSWEKGEFRDHQWIAEQPLDVSSARTEVAIALTDAPAALDLVRIKFERLPGLGESPEPVSR